MDASIKYFVDSKILKGINLKKLDFTETNKIGDGGYSSIYILRDKSGHENPNFVVKKEYWDPFQKFVFDHSKWIPFTLKSVTAREKIFLREVFALEKFEKYNIAPIILYADFKNFFLIMERMDVTLANLIKTKTFKPNQALKLVALMERYNKISLFHTDLHSDNIMWSDKLNDFRIIDWGFYKNLDELKDNKTKESKRKIDESFKKLIKPILKYAKTRITKDEPDAKKWSTLLEKLIQKYPEKVKLT